MLYDWNECYCLACVCRPACVMMLGEMYRIIQPSPDHFISQLNANHYFKNVITVLVWFFDNIAHYIFIIKIYNKFDDLVTLHTQSMLHHLIAVRLLKPNLSSWLHHLPTHACPFSRIYM